MCKLCRMYDRRSHIAKPVDFIQNPSSGYYAIKVGGEIIPPERIVKSLELYQTMLMNYAQEQMKHDFIDGQLDKLIEQVIREIAEISGISITQVDIDAFRDEIENTEELTTEQMEALTHEFFKKAKEQQDCQDE